MSRFSEWGKRIDQSVLVDARSVCLVSVLTLTESGLHVQRLFSVTRTVLVPILDFIMSGCLCRNRTSSIVSVCRLFSCEIRCNTMRRRIGERVERLEYAACGFITTQRTDTTISI